MTQVEENSGVILDAMKPSDGGYTSDNTSEIKNENPIVNEEDIDKEFDKQIKDVEANFTEFTFALERFIESSEIGIDSYCEATLMVTAKDALDRKLDERKNKNVKRVEELYVDQELAKAKVDLIESIPYLFEDKKKLKNAIETRRQAERAWNNAYKNLSTEERAMYDEGKAIVNSIIKEKIAQLKTKYTLKDTKEAAKYKDIIETVYTEETLIKKLADNFKKEPEAANNKLVKKASVAYVKMQVAKQKVRLTRITKDPAKIKKANEEFKKCKDLYNSVIYEIKHSNNSRITMATFRKLKNSLNQDVAEQVMGLKKKYENERAALKKESTDDVICEKSDIDDDMKPIIEKLNSKGYGTKYSSSGHPNLSSKSDKKDDGVKNGKLFTDARIMFTQNYKFPEAPKHWVMTSVDGCSYLDVIERTYDPKDGSPDKAWTEWKAEYMSTLKTWVDNLDSESDARNGEADKNGEDESVKTSKVEESALDREYDEMVRDFWIYS